MSKVTLLFAACVILVQQSFGEHEEICYSQMCNSSAASLLEYMDLDVDPCQDFYKFTCGKFLRNFELPEDKVSLSAQQVLEEELDNQVKGVLEGPTESNPPLFESVLKTFYQSCINTDAIEEKGTAPLLELLQNLGGWPMTTNNWDESSVDITSLLIELHDLGFTEFFAMIVYVEEKNSTLQLPVLFQPAVSFQENDYSAGLNSTKLNYLRTYMTDTLNLLINSSDTDRRAREIEEILSFEANLSKILVSPEEMRVSRQLLTTMRNLSRSFNKSVRFDDYVRGVFGKAGINVLPNQLMELYYPTYFEKLPQLLENTPPRIMINYLMWNVIKDVTPAMPRRFQNIKDQFIKSVFGVSGGAPRWKTCITSANEILPGPVGALYVKEHFKSSAKEKMLNLIEELKNAFKNMINENVWMSQEAKEVAKEKANAMREKIGYPDEFLEHDYYEDVLVRDTMDVESFFQNWLYLRRCATKDNLLHLEKKFSNNSFLMPVANVNSYNFPNLNAIEFPAGILQFPFFNEEVPMYQNFGGIGFVIGHEITHGFDDNGRLYNKDGNAIEWWKPEDVNKFVNLSHCFIDLYNGFVFREINESVNGYLTLGENIADVGGLRESFRAYKSWTTKFGNDPRLPGIQYSPEQMFFIHYGKTNCVKAKPAVDLLLIKTDNHSPSEFRVNGALMSLREFSETFNCPRNSAMNPESKCHIW